MKLRALALVLLLGGVAAPVRAQENESSVQVRVGSDASVEKLPRVRRDIVEFVVRNTPAELDALLSSRNTREIEDMNALHGGGHTWFLRMQLRESNRDVDAQIIDGELKLRVVRGMGDVLRTRVEAPSVAQLISNEIPNVGPLPDPLLLSFLPGDAMAAALEPWDYAPVLAPSPPWLPRSGWETIDRARSAMLLAPDADSETNARYRLGLHYLEMGFALEARYYFSAISARPGPVAHRDLALARGRAALASGRWEEARTHYSNAWSLGAAEAPVIEGLAVVSLMTGTPARAPTGRALTGITGRPEALMLAAELLQRDGYYAESRPILEVLDGRMADRSDAERVSLRLGDARFIDGDLPEAQRSWSTAAPDLTEVREQLVMLLRGDPASWAQGIPQLVAAAQPRTDAGAEALYLLAQVDLLVGTREDAISELAALMRRYPRKSRGSDVPERFWRVYSAHIRDLASVERWLDIASLHEMVWDRTVRRAVSDARVLVDVARAYEEVGLPARAVVVLRDAVSVLVAKGMDDPKMVVQLGELYAEVGSWQDGLDSLAYLRRQDLDLGPPGKVDMLEARLYAGAGDMQAAAEALRRAARVPERRDEATLELAMMDAREGRCARAGETLRRMLTTPKGREQYQEPGPWMALARCMNVLGRTAVAADAARRARELTESDVELRYASWIEAVASGWTDEELVQEVREGDDIWATMASERVADDAFKAELELRRSVPWNQR